MLIQICLELDGMTNICEVRTNNMVCFRYNNSNEIEFEKTIEELLIYYKNDKFDIFNSAFRKYVSLKDNSGLCP